jgi:hypothetical protein
MRRRRGPVLSPDAPRFTREGYLVPAAELASLPITAFERQAGERATRELSSRACQRNTFYEKSLGEDESQQHRRGENKSGGHKVIEGREVEALVLLQPEGESEQQLC